MSANLGGPYDPRESFPEHGAPRDSYERRYEGPATWSRNAEKAKRDAAAGKRPSLITRLRRAIFGGS